MLLAAVAAIAIAGLATAAPPAHSAGETCVKNPTPDLRPICPVSTAVDIGENLTGIDLERPDCDLDDPRAPRCAPGDKEVFAFESANPNTPNTLTNLCQVTLEGVTPNEAYSVGQVRFRTRVDCDRHMRSVGIESKLLNATQHPVAYGNTVFCHGCGGSPVDSLGGAGNTGNAEYLLVATVRLVLEEGPPGDPWVTVMGTPPDDTSNGNCIPGGTVVKCKLTLAVKSTTT